MVVWHCVHHITGLRYQSQPETQLARLRLRYSRATPRWTCHCLRPAERPTDQAHQKMSQPAGPGQWQYPKRLKIWAIVTDNCPKRPKPNIMCLDSGGGLQKDAKVCGDNILNVVGARSHLPPAIFSMQKAAALNP